MNKGQSSESSKGKDGTSFRPRILCLHGHNSCNEITEMQIFGLELDKRAKCDFLHGPYPGKAGDGLALFSNGPWYTWVDVSSVAQESLENSLEYLANHLRENGPYDGVYCFSLSCTLVTIFSDPAIWRDQFDFSDRPWKFAILACAGGLQWLETSRRRLSAKGIDIPTLHLKGATDQILDQSTKLEKYWTDATRKSYTHKGGHTIDMTILRREPELKRLLLGFLDENSSTQALTNKLEK